MSGLIRSKHFKFSTSGVLTFYVRFPAKASSRKPAYKPAYSLYSTDSEDQVTVANKSLDKCAKLLATMLDKDSGEIAFLISLKKKFVSCNGTKNGAGSSVKKNLDYFLFKKCMFYVCFILIRSLEGQKKTSEKCLPVQKWSFQETVCPKIRQDGSWLSPWINIENSYLRVVLAWIEEIWV